MKHRLKLRTKIPIHPLNIEAVFFFFLTKIYLLFLCRFSLIFLYLIVFKQKMSRVFTLTELIATKLGTEAFFYNGSGFLRLERYPFRSIIIYLSWEVALCE